MSFSRGAQLVEHRLDARLQESNEKDRKKMEEIRARFVSF